MISRRQFAFAIGAVTLGQKVESFAQQPKIRKIGFLGVETAEKYANRIQALRTGLRDFGYIEGKNISVIYRWAEGNYERLPQLATELVRLEVDVVVTHTQSGTRAVQAASATVPIVMTDVSDADLSGLVQSFSRPGGKTTGSSFQGAQLNAKRLELLREIVPGLRRVALLVDARVTSSAAIRNEVNKVAKSMNMELREFHAHQPVEFDALFKSMARSQIQAAMVQEAPLFTVNTGALASLALQYRVPLAGFSDFARAGALIGYGVDFPELYRRAAYFVDRILNGVKPSELPIEQPTKFEMVINRKTAKSLGLTIPKEVLLRADEVVE